MFLSSSGFWGSVGWGPLLLLMYPVCSSLRGGVFICSIGEVLEKSGDGRLGVAFNFLFYFSSNGLVIKVIYGCRARTL